jgi:hypothetical protein
VHPPHIKEAALALIAQGVNDCEISRMIDVPRRTIMDWRRPTYVPRREVPLETCPRCWRAAKPMRFTAEDYTELLGLYLGDGCISPGARTHRLRVALDNRYPGIITELEALLRRCFPMNSVGVTAEHAGCDCVVVWVYSQHLVCLFPQHGPGKKHDRKIELEPWQWRLVEEAPWSLLRGLIRSDGCAFINRTGPYEYLSYDFGNLSKDLIDIFTTTCDLVGVEYRATQYRRRWSVRINRRASVSLMQENVGLKA